jgi:hypothetical protein
VSLVIFILGGSVAIALNTGLTNGAVQNGCGHANTKKFIVTIVQGKVSDRRIVGKLCDHITFINKDSILREIGFGPHDSHQPYDGIGEKVLNQDDVFTITLNKTGKFYWHDHLHDGVDGYFTVTK